MRLLLGQDQHGPVVSGVIVVGAVTLLGLTVFAGYQLHTLGPIFALVVIFAVSHQFLLRWRTQIALVVLVILLIPMKRYSLPASLPLNLEPYRLLVAFVALGWLTSLLIDPRVRFRRTVIDAPLAAFAVAVIFSDLANHQRVASVQSEVVKKLLFFLSFLIIVYLIASLVRRFEDIDFVTGILTGGGAVVALFALIEARTGFDVFDHLQTAIPFLHLDAANLPHIPPRGGRLRVYASAQHPIALGSAMAMLIPFAIYRAHCYGQRRWWGAATLLLLAALATGSRTAVVVLGMTVVTYAWLRPVQVRRRWPLLIPALLVIHFATPGSLGTIRAALFPKGGIIAQQTNQAVGSGRLATLGPALHTEFDPNPFLGEGFGTRIPTQDPGGPPKNGPILDDQWLGTLLETGLIGTLALLWVFVRLIRRAAPAAREDSPRGWFLVAVIASVAGFFASMFFYDAFSFYQVTFILFIVMGLGAAALALPDSVVVRTRAPSRGVLPVRPRPKRPRNRLAWATLGVLAVLALATVTAVMATHDFGSNGKPGAGSSAKPVGAVANVGELQPRPHSSTPTVGSHARPASHKRATKQIASPTRPVQSTPVQHTTVSVHTTPVASSTSAAATHSGGPAPLQAPGGASAPSPLPSP